MRSTICLIPCDRRRKIPCTLLPFQAPSGKWTQLLDCSQWRPRPWSLCWTIQLIEVPPRCGFEECLNRIAIIIHLVLNSLAFEPIPEVNSWNCLAYRLQHESCAGLTLVYMRWCLQWKLNGLRVDKGKYASRKILLGSDGSRESASVADFFVVYLEGQLIMVGPLLGYPF